MLFAFFLIPRQIWAITPHLQNLNEVGCTYQFNQLEITYAKTPTISVREDSFQVMRHLNSLYIADSNWNNSLGGGGG